MKEVIVLDLKRVAIFLGGILVLAGLHFSTLTDTPTWARWWAGAAWAVTFGAGVAIVVRAYLESVRRRSRGDRT